jgi:hypothetical protein
MAVPISEYQTSGRSRKLSKLNIFTSSPGSQIRYQGRLFHPVAPVSIFTGRRRPLADQFEDVIGPGGKHQAVGDDKRGQGDGDGPPATGDMVSDVRNTLKTMYGCRPTSVTNQPDTTATKPAGVMAMHHR